jgi:hypothetical protein
VRVAPYDPAVTVAVDLERLWEQVRAYGPAGFVVTVGDDGRPHVVSAHIEVAGGELAGTVGKTTAANVARSGSATLLWPAPPGGEYSLIVDGTAAVRDDPAGRQVAVTPVRAVLHRVAGAPAELPSCVTVVDRRA